MGVGTVLAECAPPSHSTIPPSPSDAEDHLRTSVHPPHPPKITPLNFHAELVVSPSSYHMCYFIQPPSSHSSVPLDDVVLCSSILDSSLVVNEEQPTDEVSVARPTCVVIHEKYEWELEGVTTKSTRKSSGVMLGEYE